MMKETLSLSQHHAMFFIFLIVSSPEIPMCVLRRNIFVQILGVEDSLFITQKKKISVLNTIIYIYIYIYYSNQTLSSAEERMIISVEERDPRQDLVLGRCSPVFGQRFVHLFRLVQNLGSMGLAVLNRGGPK
jgi:hypothetical protein